MARFDVYQFHGAVPLVLDIQANLLGDLKTTIVVPLLPVSEAEKEYLPRLKPVLVIKGQQYLMVTTDLAAVPRASLGKYVTNLENEYRDVITMALDFLLQGF